MSADDPTDRKPQQSQADRTLLGVAPPKLESSPDAKLSRSPVFVRSGTASGGEGDEPLPLPRMALPSRPQVPTPLDPAGPSAASPSLPLAAGSGLGRQLRTQPLLWMVALPSAVALIVIGVVALTAPPAQPKPPRALVATAAADRAVPPRQATDEPSPRRDLAALAALEGKLPETLTARELVQLAEGRAERERQAAKTLREQIAANSELANDKVTQAKLLGWVQQRETSHEALLALSAIDGPLGPDLLYEAWTGTSARTGATELARALVYSADVRPRASKALSVALDLRAADTCEKNREVLPRALTDGDKRSLHLLVKLSNKRGCGPKKLDDCFACLRASQDELAATINAVKARRAPSYPAP